MAIACNRQNAARRIAAAIMADCRASLDEQGRLAFKDVVKLVAKHRRQGYLRGWGAMYQRAARLRA